MRTDKDTVRTLAREFARSRMADAWFAFSSDVRSALLDAAIMDHVRMAAACDADKPMTPSELVEFRRDFARELHRGVPRGSAGRLRFVVDDTAIHLLPEIAHP